MIFFFFIFYEFLENEYSDYISLGSRKSLVKTALSTLHIFNRNDFYSHQTLYHNDFKILSSLYFQCITLTLFFFKFYL